MGQKGPVTTDHNVLFPFQIGKKIIVAQDHLKVAVLIDPGRDHMLAALRVSQMDQHIQMSCPGNDLFQVSVFSMSITDN